MSALTCLQVMQHYLNREHAWQAHVQLYNGVEQIADMALHKKLKREGSMRFSGHALMNKSVNDA